MWQRLLEALRRLLNPPKSYKLGVLPGSIVADGINIFMRLTGGGDNNVRMLFDAGEMSTSGQDISLTVVDAVTMPVTAGALTVTPQSITLSATAFAVPVITSNGAGATASISRPENQTAVTTVTATGTPTPTFALAGGADAARFTINSSTGVLTFLSSPDFETPTDSNADNVYQVVVQATNSVGSDTQTISVTVTDVNEETTVGDLYVATTGNDTTGNGTVGNPYRTIGRGITAMAAGQTLVVKAGTYNGLANFINHTRNVAIPSGSASNRTRIVAEYPGAVRLTNSGTLNFFDNMIQLTGSYTDVEGFICDMTATTDPEHVAGIGGSYNRVRKCFFKRSGVMSQYGGWITVHGHHNLVEDCAGVGHARYGFETGGPDSTDNSNIFRRCVGRVDYSTSPQPKATFAAYGNNDGTLMRDVLFQNCIAIDGRRGPSSSEDTYGGFYLPKNARDVTFQGCIVLNVEAGHSGYFVKEQQAQGITLTNCVAYGGSGASHIAGIRANGSTGTPLLIDHCTVGSYTNAYYNQDSAASRTLRNSLFIGNTARMSGSDFGWTSATHNAFSPAAQATGTNAITSGVTLSYLVRQDAGNLIGTANDGGNVGATVLKAYGATGTVWGETGYNTITTDNLWPWSNEDVIKALFSESNTPPSGSTPSSNTTTRGFCAAGNDAFGQPRTLTRYIWQYLGNQIPSGIY